MTLEEFLQEAETLGEWYYQWYYPFLSFTNRSTAIRHGIFKACPIVAVARSRHPLESASKYRNSHWAEAARDIGLDASCGYDSLGYVVMAASDRPARPGDPEIIAEVRKRMEGWINP